MTTSAEPPGDPFVTALVAELGRKTGVCWLRYGGQEHAAWHVWLDGSLHLVCGGEEQPLPGIDEVDTVEVLMRSKENGGRLVTWVGTVTALSPSAEAWEAVTTALVAGRLNLGRLTGTPERWAEQSTVLRIAPTGEVLERPGALDDGAGLAAPRSTVATTRGTLPRVLHRRQRRRPDLT